MDRVVLRYLWALLAFLVLHVDACTSYGVNFANGGSYNIDSSSNQYFSFVSVFQECSGETLNPILISPDNNHYVCSAINTHPNGVEVTSTCGIPYSAMISGTWKIVLSGNEIKSQRVIHLTIGVPQTTWVTATPTVVVGYTTTARAQTVLTTLIQTHTLIIVPQTVTAPCSGGTRTVTNYPPNPTYVVTSTAVRTVTDAQVTSYWTTTITSTASCHYPTSFLPPVWSPPGGGWGWPTRGPWAADLNTATEKKRDVAVPAATAAAAAVAAVTSTITQTTYTVTSTVTTTIPGRTTTETVLRTTTATITPPPSTVCVGGAPGVTVTVNVGTPTPVTQTSIVYLTSHLYGTVWVGQTQYTTFTNTASATACWMAGGWFS